MVLSGHIRSTVWLHRNAAFAQNPGPVLNHRRKFCARYLSADWLPAITGPLIYKDSVSSLKTAAKEKSCDDSTNLIIAVHHFQSPTRLLFLHMPQGTLQAEDNIFVLLYNLPKYKQVGEMQWAPSWSRVMDTVFSFVMCHYTYISL